MATSNPTKDPNTATADDAAIQDLPESKDSTALTPDEEKNVLGGLTQLSGGMNAASPSSTSGRAIKQQGVSGN
jgi:hypothetical protein